jgi:hypothetical protein
MFSIIIKHFDTFTEWGGIYPHIPNFLFWAAMSVPHVWAVTYLWLKSCIIALTTDPTAELSVRRYRKAYYGVMGCGWLSMFLWFFGKPFFGAGAIFPKSVAFTGSILWCSGGWIGLNLGYILRLFKKNITIQSVPWLGLPIALLFCGQGMWWTMNYHTIFLEQNVPPDDKFRNGFLYAQVVLFGVIAVKVFIVDTVFEHKQQKKKPGFKLQRDLLSMLLFFWFSLISPWSLNMIIQDMLTWANREAWKLCAMMILWSCIMVFMYLLVRIIASRVFRYEHMPAAMFPVHLISDILSEAIMGDFRIDDPVFWVVLVFDLCLLVMRDADLWADFGNFIKAYLGKCASKYVYLAMMITGSGDEVGDMLAEKTVIASAFQSADIPPSIRRQVRDATITQCAYTELLSSVVLLSNTVFELMLGQPILTSGMTHEQRREVPISYCIILTFQIMALTLSHKVLRYKDKRYSTEHGRAMPHHKQWHCFYSHKKEHAHTEQWVISVKDALWTEHHLKGFFDRDNLEEITQEELNNSIDASCTLLVFLDDKTLDSQWCVAEIKEAVDRGVAVYTVVNNTYFTTKSLTELWFSREREIPFDFGPLGSTLFRHPIIEFSNSNRADCIQKLATKLEGATQRLLDQEAKEFNSHSKNVQHGLTKTTSGSGWKRANAPADDEFVDNPLSAKAGRAKAQLESEGEFAEQRRVSSLTGAGSKTGGNQFCSCINYVIHWNNCWCICLSVFDHRSRGRA